VRRLRGLVCKGGSKDFTIGVALSDRWADRAVRRERGLESLRYCAGVSSHVVISYSRSDRAYVDVLARHLNAEQIPTWYDYELAAGDRFDSVIQAQIDSCAALVVVLSPAAVASAWVGREISYAVGRRIPVLPLLLEACEPGLLLAGIHLDDVSDGRLPPARFTARLRARLASATPEPVAKPAPERVIGPAAAEIQEPERAEVAGLASVEVTGPVLAGGPVAVATPPAPQPAPEPPSTRAPTRHLERPSAQQATDSGLARVSGLS
jgi:hypothetical protein